jgi:hypothetical protein
MEDLEASRACERPEDVGLEDRDLIHGLTIEICALADECRAAPFEGDRGHITTAPSPPWHAAAGRVVGFGVVCSHNDPVDGCEQRASEAGNRSGVNVAAGLLALRRVLPRRTSGRS